MSLASLAPGPGAQRPTADVIRRIDALFADLDTTTSPGCVLAVYRDGEVAYARGYGMADLERGVRLTESSVFDIGSTSKQFVAFGVLLLEHDGALALDDDVREFVPELPDYGAAITIRHLLHHTSGIRDYLVLMALAGLQFEHDYPEAQILDLLARQQALEFDPGSAFSYSNSGYFLLGLIAARVAGQPLGEFLRERIFAPLGMRATLLYDDAKRIVSNRALGYTLGDDGAARTEVYLFDLVGDGGVLTSVRDLLRWDRNFYDNRLGGGQELIARMQAPGRLQDGTELDYACGLRVARHRGLRVVDHGGAWAGYRAQLLRFPEQRLSVALLANTAPFDVDAKAYAVAEILLGDLLEPAAASAPDDAAPAVDEVPAVEPDAAAPSDSAGDFHSEELDVTWHLRVAADTSALIVGIGYESDVGRLTATARDELVGPGTVVHLERDADGRVVALSVDAGPVHGIRFFRID